MVGPTESHHACLQGRSGEGGSWVFIFLFFFHLETGSISDMIAGNFHQPNERQVSLGLSCKERGGVLQPSSCMKHWPRHREEGPPSLPDKSGSCHPAAGGQWLHTSAIRQGSSPAQHTDLPHQTLKHPPGPILLERFPSGPAPPTALLGNMFVPSGAAERAFLRSHGKETFGGAPHPITRPAEAAGFWEGGDCSLNKNRF